MPSGEVLLMGPLTASQPIMRRTLWKKNSVTTHLMRRMESWVLRHYCHFFSRLLQGNGRITVVSGQRPVEGFPSKVLRDCVLRIRTGFFVWGEKALKRKQKRTLFLLIRTKNG